MIEEENVPHTQGFESMHAYAHSFILPFIRSCPRQSFLAQSRWLQSLGISVMSSYESLTTPAIAQVIHDHLLPCPLLFSLYHPVRCASRGTSLAGTIAEQWIRERLITWALEEAATLEAELRWRVERTRRLSGTDQSFRLNCDFWMITGLC